MSDPPKRVRVIPYFAVETEDHQLLSVGATARVALQDAKDTNGDLLVVNGRLVEATGWAGPTYPDDDQLLQQVLELTGGVVIDKTWS